MSRMSPERGAVVVETEQGTGQRLTRPGTLRSLEVHTRSLDRKNIEMLSWPHRCMGEDGRKEATTMDGSRKQGNGDEANIEANPDYLTQSTGL